jgi:hypothetical protein
LVLPLAAAAKEAVMGTEDPFSQLSDWYVKKSQRRLYPGCEADVGRWETKKVILPPDGTCKTCGNYFPPTKEHPDGLGCLGRVMAEGMQPDDSCSRWIRQVEWEQGRLCKDCRYYEKHGACYGPTEAQGMKPDDFCSRWILKIEE